MNEDSTKPDSDSICRVEDLAVHFPMGGGITRRPASVALSRCRRRRSGTQARRVSRPGRRIGLRKDRPSLSPSLGLQMPTRGRIILDGKDVSGQRRDGSERRAHIRPDGLSGPVFILNPRQTVRKDAGSAATPPRCGRARSEVNDRDRRRF